MEIFNTDRMEIIVALLVLVMIGREIIIFLTRRGLKGLTKEYIDRLEFDMLRLEIEKNFVKKSDLHKDIELIRKQVEDSKAEMGKEMKEIKEELRGQREILSKIFFKLSE